MENVVVVTGFDSFGEFKINPSWEVVKLLKSNVTPFKLVTEQIPVEYEAVDAKVKQLWNDHQPKLMVHVGVSSVAKYVTIECEAHRCGYVKKDNLGLAHSTTEVCCFGPEAPDLLKCHVNIDAICQQINDKFGEIVACTSTDAGRYLCEYIFYSSLKINKGRTLFIHVPSTSYQKSSDILMCIIQSVLIQLDCSCNA